jgi:hypothetical protein
MNGLRMTRDYRSLTYWFRASFRFVSKFTFDPLELLGVKFGLIKTRQRTLVWTKTHTWDPIPPPDPAVHRTAHHHGPSPSIEFTDFSTAESVIQDTPAMAHSSFPQPITPRRTRNESDASYTEPILPTYGQYRTSRDSHSPLIPRPSDVRRSRATSANHDRRPSDEDEGGRSSDVAEHRSSSEYMLSPTLSSDEQPVFRDWLGTVQSRQGYHRANSDNESPPPPLGNDRIGTAREGLGLGMDTGNSESRSGN